MDWDEGPYRQTDRLDLYKQHAMELLEKGKAYWCICTAEELEARRKEAQAKGAPLKYNGQCRDQGITSPTQPAALRFKSPQEGQTVVDDLIKGQIVFDNTVLDDLIILRTNGYPTYNLSVVIDDALMNITHVIRGDDHVNNTPRQVAIFEALGFSVPQFAHMPMILGSDKSRLSKRHGATSVLEYQKLGYLPEALVNYLVRLGWSHGDQEIFTITEMIEHFTLQNVQKASAIFNPRETSVAECPIHPYLRTQTGGRMLASSSCKNKVTMNRAYARIPGGVQALVPLTRTFGNPHWTWLSVRSPIFRRNHYH